MRRAMTVSIAAAVLLTMTASPALATGEPTTTTVTASVSPATQTLPYGSDAFEARDVTLTLTFSVPVSPDTPIFCDSFGCYGPDHGQVVADAKDAAGDSIDFLMYAVPLSSSECGTHDGDCYSANGHTTWRGTGSVFSYGTYTVQDIIAVAPDGYRFPPTTTTVTVSQAAKPVVAKKPTKFANCTAMHHYYKGGLAKPGAHDKRASGRAEYKPTVSAALYAKNKGLDRDHDGIACEA